MNEIVRSFLDNHCKEYELKPASIAFEHFVNYIILRNYTSRHFSPSLVGTENNEMGLDGLAIVVNDVIVSCREEVEDIFAKSTKDNKVDFIMTQAKTSEHFSSSEMALFSFSVRSFFDKRSRPSRVSAKMGELLDITDYIFANSIKLGHNPACHLYFATTGSWKDDPNLQRVIIDGINSLKSLQLFSDVDFVPYDNKRIIEAYRSIKNSLTRQIEIEYSAIVPQIADIKEAYIGLARCVDYIRLLTNDDGKLITSLFEDNVRYFQGYNPVNMEIHETLCTGQNQKPFPLLNNGVTIVAKDIRRTGNTFVLTDFQVVNGCQTSFVLYENKEHLENDTYMVIKLVSTEDKDLTGRIVKATNRQTSVLTEAFETLRDFHKDLELAYAAYEEGYRLYYERRSKQYDSHSINKNKIVSFAVQISAYVGMFLGEPHSTHRYYGELLESNRKRMFRDGDVPQQYCITTMYLNFVERWVKANSPEKKAYKYHYALMLRCLIYPQELPRSNSRQMDAVCKSFYEALKDEGKMEGYMRQSVAIIDEAVLKALDSGVDVLNLPRTKELTNHIIKASGFERKKVAPVNDVRPLRKGNVFECLVKAYNKSFVYVEILEHRETGFIHIGELENRFIANIGEIVRIGETVRAILTSDVRNDTFGYELSKKQAVIGQPQPRDTVVTR